MLRCRLFPTNFAQVDDILFGGSCREIAVAIVDWLYPWPFDRKCFLAAGPLDMPDILRNLLIPTISTEGKLPSVTMMKPDDCDARDFTWAARNSHTATLQKFLPTFSASLIETVDRLRFYDVVERQADVVIGCRGADSEAVARLPYANILLRLVVGGNTDIPEDLPVPLIGSMMNAGHGTRLSIISARSEIPKIDSLASYPGRYIPVEGTTIIDFARKVSRLWVPDTKYAHRSENPRAQAPLLSCGAMSKNFQQELVSPWDELTPAEITPHDFLHELRQCYCAINVVVSNDQRRAALIMTNGCTAPLCE